MQAENPRGSRLRGGEEQAGEEEQACRCGPVDLRAGEEEQAGRGGPVDLRASIWQLSLPPECWD